MRYKSPCQFCEDREIGCHSKCEKYIAFQNDIASIREERLKQLKINDARYIAAEQNARRNGKRFGDGTRR